MRKHIQQLYYSNPKQATALALFIAAIAAFAIPFVAFCAGWLLIWCARF